jgi:hypothetical protein
LQILDADPGLRLQLGEGRGRLEDFFAKVNDFLDPEPDPDGVIVLKLLSAVLATS